jgi:hypothetical protein
MTGQLRRETGLPETLLLPTQRGDRLLYLAQTNPKESRIECGTMDPDTFARTRLFEFQSEKFGEGGFFALSRDGKRLVYCAENAGKWVAHVLERGQPEKSLPLEAVGKLNLGNLQFSPKSDVLYVSFMEQGANPTNTSFGFLEVPLGGGPVRRNILIANAGRQDDGGALYFQFDISHDGKALAVASTYLDIDHPLKPEDSALFLVDLSGPNRKVTRVPIPLPPEPHPAPAK